jgi:hypothetical protein
MSSTPPNRRGKGDNATAIAISVIHFFTTLVDRFGWPGAFLIAALSAIQLWSTSDQKHAMIDKYILGVGMKPWWPFVVLSVLFLLLAWAQHLMYRREVKVIKAEMRRIGAKKSELQEEIARKPLRHGHPDE